MRTKTKRELIEELRDCYAREEDLRARLRAAEQSPTTDREDEHAP